ncbi:glycine N-acyltransferase-like protein 2, partial [Rhinatrema bivittatum]|uniref:glycine N-acyltransferase-like protein 2 n=1 Tax=Rhinatrema bivittatum TaxID=194408 RepID=UPI00112AE5B6
NKKIRLALLGQTHVHPAQHPVSDSDQSRLQVPGRSPIVDLFLVSHSQGDGQTFRLAPLSECHAGQVNQGWGFGGNEHSLRYIQRCIRHFPSFSATDSDGNPVSWVVTEQSSEYRMGFTVPERRNTGIWKQVLVLITQPPFRILEHAPIYGHVAEGNEASKRATMGAGFHIAPGNWYQWTCHPITSPL